MARPVVPRLIPLAPWILGAAIGFGSGGCSSEPDAIEPSRRACGLHVWHKPASAESHVEIVGDFQQWKRPGVFPDLTPDGWRAAVLDVPPGEQRYAIIEDGVWLADRQVPMSAFHEGQEVALAMVPDCEQPELRVESVVASASASASATIHARFLAARGNDAALDAASIAFDGLPSASVRVVTADARTGEVVLEVIGLARGKSMLHLTAADARGRRTAPAHATLWNEAHPWDPRDAIVYQVVLDRFRGEAGPLVPPKTPADRAGGTLAGLRKAVEAGEMERLGVNTLWLSPLYRNPDGVFPGTDGRLYSSYHGYWPTASRALDPRVTTEEELDRFMRAAHERGLRVLFDVVPNHVHEQHPWVKEHPDWFVRDCTCGQGACDWATHIKTCWFAPYLPDLDWRNPDVARAVTADVMWWFDRWGADGLRIDAVPMMPRAATRRIAEAVRVSYAHEGNVPYILGENFTGPGGFDNLRYDLGPFGLDGSFHFPLMWTLRQTIAEEKSTMAEIDASFRAGEKAWDGSGAVMGMMIDNHDVSRFASVSAGNASGDAWSPAPQPVDPLVYAKQRLALATVLTLPGAPVLYYGDEVGLAGKNDPDSRRVMPADDALLDAQRDTRSVVGRIGRARSCSAALRRGALRTISAENERFVFARELPGDVKGAAIVALGRRPPLTADVRLPPGAPLAMVDVVTGARVDTSAGALELPSDAFGVHVYVDAAGPCAKAD